MYVRVISTLHTLNTFIEFSLHWYDFKFNRVTHFWLRYINKYYKKSLIHGPLRLDTK